MSAELNPVLSHFRDMLPYRPYCSDDLRTGLVIRGRDQALQHRYIQPNPPGLVGWLVFDVDRPLAVLAWEWNEANLPLPNITAMNPVNGHAHLFYALAAPVCTSPAARSRPLRYAAAIEAAYRARLRADPGYSGLIAKNPLREDCWRVHSFHTAPYELGYLAEWVDLRPLSAKNAVQGLGRNCTLFDNLRYWAYDQILAYRSARQSAWMASVLNRAEALNVFPVPLPFSEVKSTAKSVGTWCWKHFTRAALQSLIDHTHAPEAQARRGRIGGIASGRTRAEKAVWRKTMALELYSKGRDEREIAAILGVSLSAVRHYLYRKTIF